MEAKLICTDVYVRVFFLADCHEFVLTRREDGTAIPMKEILRDFNSVIYYGSTSFIHDEERISFTVDFAYPSRPTFNLPSLEKRSRISDSYPQFSPKEDALTFHTESMLWFQEPPLCDEVYSWWPTLDRRHLLQRTDGCRGSWSGIEIHCYKRHDDV